MFAQRARDNLACVAFCALVGGQDELVFDGHSFVIDHTGATIARAAQFREELLVCDVDLHAAAAARLREAGHRAAVRSPAGAARVSVLPGLPELPSAAGTAASAAAPAPGGPLAVPIEPLEAEVYAALTLGLHDYVEKNGFGHVVLGLSGGIDSALVACLAADALGAERVTRDDHALALLLLGDAAGRAHARSSARRRRPRARDRARGRGLRRARSGRPSTAASTTSPRRTCRRGSAATC